VPTVKPIETVYHGYRFRSRLEARWAVFFDALGIEWVYEPEGYDLGELGWYLPDFWLPQLGCLAEVKPRTLTLKEWAKCNALPEICLLLDGQPVARWIKTTGMEENLTYEQYLDPNDTYWSVDLAMSISKGHLWFCFEPYGKEDSVFENLYEVAIRAARSARFEHDQ
jgi:hypothetical protein